MKKSIFLFFAAILCAMTANAQLYLRGGFNDWNNLTDDYQFVDNVCEIELAGATTYEFKIADSGWGTQFGNGEFTATATKTLTSNGGNMKITTTIPGTYKFEFVQNTKKLTVTYPTVPAPHDITVRAKVPAHWTNDIYAHVWTSENGSGQDVGPLTKNGDYYEVTRNAGALYVIFKNGSAWSNKNQTVDLCYTEDVCLQINQSGSDKATATVIDCGAVAKDITVKAVVPEAWGDNVWAHVWETGASGTDVKLTEKEGNWYVCTKNCLELNIIFKSGEGWSNIEQTADITGVKENACYSISSINKTDGKCNVTEVDCDDVIEPEAKPEDIYTIVGTATLVGTAWDLNNTDNDMTKQTDGSYVLVKEDVELTTTGTYEYKVVKNRSWDWKDINSGNNITLTGVEKDGIYDVTFTLNKELNELSVNLELIEETKIILDCYVSGDESLVGTGKGWNADAVVMTYNEDTEVYTATLSGVPAGTHNMKVVYGGAWLGYDKLSTPAPANVSEGEDNKIQFILEEAGDVTVTYHATNGIGLSGNFAAPTPATYTVVGHKDILGESWNLASTINIMTETDGNYTLTKTGLQLEAGDYEYKVVKNGAYGEGEYPNGTNEKVTIAENGVYTIVYTYKVGTSLEAVATKTGDYTPDKATYTVAGDIALCGTNWKADDETNDMTDNGDGTFTWAKTGIELATNVSFKVVKNHDFENESYPSDNWVINIEGSDGVYNITITFTESNKEIKVEKTRTGDLPKKTLVYTVTVPAGTKQCYIAGDMNSWTAQAMTPAGTNKFSISIDNVTIATGYKYTCKDGDDTWAYVEKKNGNGEVVNRTYNANDVVERWNRIDISDGENAAIIGSHAGKGKVEVYVDRELKAGQLYTISLPFAVADADGLFGSGTVVYEYADLKYENDEYALYFDNTKNAMEAGKPYLVQPGSDRDGFEYKDTEVVFSEKATSKTLNNTTISMESVLSVTAGATTNGKYWLASDNCLYNVSTALKSLRAVFNIQSNKANVRARIAFGENVETGVDNIVTTDTPVKVIKNGQLIIIRDGVKYNVQGQKL